MSKLGRNQPCWCGSGKKYKKCHLNIGAPPKMESPVDKPHIDSKFIQKMRANKDAEESRRISMQGKGRPIISTEFQGHRIVATGNKIYYSSIEKTQTFVDFLGKYVQSLLTANWGNSEIAKPFDERHPIMQWYDGLCKIQKQYYKPDKVFETPSVGLVMAYNSLAYNLYLLDHSSTVQNHLLKRIKDKESFFAAYYETFVAAWFILAGFKLSLENETDPTTTHCEFVAEAPSGKCYSVEAKCRASGKNNLAIGNQLYKALRKRADHPRIICIEMSVNQGFLNNQESFQNEIVNRIRNSEESLTIEDEPAPPAYIFVTNISYHLHLQEEQGGRALLADGFKIDDFGYKQFRSLTEGFKARQKHADVLSVTNAFERYSIPATFNEELPEFAFSEEERRFTIGDRHKMDDGTIGTLQSGIVVTSEKMAYLTYETDDGKHLIYRGPLSDAEISAYKRHPETFFGRIESVAKTLTDPMDWYEFFYENFKNAPRGKILGWFQGAEDYGDIEKLNTKELRYLYAERHTLAVLSKNNR